MQRRLRPFLILLLLAGGTFLPGTACRPAAERLDRRDERDPLIVRGDARKRAGDVDGAVALYQKALDRNPNLALAHLKLGVEFDDQKRDYLRAIYHYSRYLELRPGAEKREMVSELIRMAHASYLAALPNPPPGAIERIAVLEGENERLRHQVSDLARQLREARDTPPQPAEAIRLVETRADPVQEKPPAAEQPRTYRVRRGDNLSRIAHEKYGDAGQWKKIFEANRDQLMTPDSLREGQLLAIP